MRSNLRPARSTFIGRAADLEAVETAFAAGDRLVTLTGPGGMGKTRLSMECALRRLADATLQAEEGDAIFFCDLSEATDLASIAAAVARAMDIPLTSGTDPAAQIGRALAASGPSLLVLDNFEQIVAHAAATVGTWMAAAPAALFLATSRERLHLTGERAIELGPLPVPDESALARPSDAVALLVERMARLRRAYVASDDDRAVLGKIARQLDGIPLALELAAGRLSVLSPDALHERLQARPALLGRGSTDAAARQRTMEDAIDWSWNLLDPPERTALAECAVFRGGFSMDAAEAILERPDRAAIDVVQALRDKSLLRSWEPAERPGEVRLGLYRVVHDFAAARLRETGDAAARARHAGFYADLGERLAAGVDGKEGPDCLARLSLERENLEAAFDTALRGSPTVALRALLALDRLLWIRGPLGAHIGRLDAAVDCGGSAPPALSAKVHRARGNTRRRLGPAEKGASDLEAALALARQAGDASLEGDVQTDLAALGVQRGDWAMARAHVDDALDVLRRVADRRGLALALGVQGAVHHQSGRPDEARAAYDEAIALHREAGNVRGEGMCWTALAAVHVDRGELEDARACQEKGFAIQKEIGDRFQGYSLYTLGVLQHDAGDLDAAERAYEEARGVARAVGDRRLDALCQGYVALSLCERGRFADALALLDRATAILAEGWDRRYGALLRALHGGAMAAVGRVDSAKSAFEEAEKALAGPGDALLLESVGVLRGLLDLAQAARTADAERAFALRQAARSRRAAALAPGPDGGRSLASRSAEARILLRVLGRALEEKETPAEHAVATLDPSIRPLLVHPDGRWFQAPGGERVECHRRPSIRRMVVALARKRLESPGDGITADGLLAIGWPGERILPDAAKNRLHVTLTRMRQLGLQEVLRTSSGGYLLDPAVPVRFVE